MPDKKAVESLRRVLSDLQRKVDDPNLTDEEFKELEDSIQDLMDNLGRWEK